MVTKIKHIRSLSREWELYKINYEILELKSPKVEHKNFTENFNSRSCMAVERSINLKFNQLKSNLKDREKNRLKLTEPQ